jgi:hypothetical protein
VAANHTPTPWHVVDNEQYLEIVVPWKDNPSRIDQYCPSVVSVIAYESNDGINGRDNAAFIVRACNSHDQMVAALKNLEVAANTAQYCYDHKPENFAFAMSDLAEVAETAREVLAAQGAA